MTHASMEMLVAYADGELGELEEQHTARHLDSCAQCAGELAGIVESRTLFSWTLGWVDRAEPAAWDAADRVVAAPAGALIGSDAPIDLASVRQQRVAALQPVAATAAPGRTAWRWAAGLVLVAGAATAAIVSPVIVERIWPEPDAAVGRTAEGAATSSGAVAVQPVDGSIAIALSGAVDGTRLHVEFESRQDVVVDYSASEAPGFTARDGVIGIELAGTGTTLLVSVPADMRDARVLVNGLEAALLSRGEVVRARADLGIMIEVSNTGR